ncbi:cell cycle regulator of non-homologous end joining isoform X1 [Rhinopithecus roxellana]|uniref:cell cycle regulator of non-homologous end joining isoform X1 n=1 Tax=Rhinopithecus roxellana TaxID=61622 RepID=UPI0012375F36|nr:cell cycle regulator of non-homologous end joining isoform X1 [Rhinopithecus roxellana]XP_010356287.2 cell cycle regulator of non-homologous end joining isoform X1 [Rhinopithecus roxellana]XP_010356288.2 cell cycle regulator of non-homologous end joining isoform X1 [Rhinopithecus roxellana]XP_030788959.1 cell cycle regulator of non-homologous end joining isoform X1 [Rhinopithecus roxellana]
METLQSETKKRVLPSWLTAQVATKNVAPAKAPKRMRMAAVPVAAARLPATRTVYCMNEAEIVDVALGILIESRKQEKACEQPALAGADNPELSPPCSLSPHTSSGSSSEEEDSGKEALAAGLSPSQRPGDSNSACSRSPKEEEEEEEDVLKYVREIFFS